ncbi:nitroreductase family protein [Rhabdothermincola salaria]|uniref:nitroreductase family protein n=1 Tax=Rhabdothermincola salaria TaxID=2903142 RepID=UPI001E5D7DF7|nr:nitroreductase family protein [Rhabdothermincola salaria]
MEFADVVRRRRMVRAFDGRPVPGDVLDRILDLAVRIPAAGNTQGLDLVVLEGAETARYWDVSLPAERRRDFPWPGLLRAPVLLVPVGDPSAYVERYAEPDKVATGLGTDPDAWPVPYWYVDTAFAAMVALLAAVDEGLGACFFGQFEHESALKASLGIPADRCPVGTIALGYADPLGDRRSFSAARPRRSLESVVHRGGW